jgi:Rod binding domain-containing protein
MSNALQSAADFSVTQNTSPSLMNRAARTNTPQTIDKAASDFENMFMTQMLQPMFDTVGVDPLFGGGHGEEMMRGFLVQEYGKVAAGGSHLGLASAVRDELLRAQQQQSTNLQTSQGAAYARPVQ